MKRSEAPMRHRRPWWQFNVIVRALVLIALVDVRYFAKLSQVYTIAWTGVLLAGWVALGVLGFYVQAI